MSGVSASCPKSKHMEDGTKCIEKGKCQSGKCIPFCETVGEQVMMILIMMMMLVIMTMIVQSCMCDSSADACKRCCR